MYSILAAFVPFSEFEAAYKDFFFRGLRQVLVWVVVGYSTSELVFVYNQRHPLFPPP
jgi:hypothetical protein